MKDLSYQLYSSRKFPPLTETLAFLAAQGYTQVEGYGSLYADDAAVAELARGLKATKLKMPTGHFALDMVRKQPARVLEIARAFKMKGVIIPYIMPDDRPKDARGWRAFGKKLAKAGAPIWDAGLFFGYHNHDFEYAPLPNGALPIDLLMEGDPRLMLEFDVAWAVRTGSDPIETIRKYGKRIRAAHVKDIAKAGKNKSQDGWCNIGEGKINWAKLTPILRNSGCKYLVMEHDNPKDDREFAATAMAALKTY